MKFSQGLLLISLLCFPALAQAMPMEARPAGPLDWLSAWLEETDSQFFGFYEVGARSSLDDFEDNSLDSDYDYTKLNFRFSQKLEGDLDYSVSILMLDKDYDTVDTMDNAASTVRVGTDWQFWAEDKKTLTFSFDLTYAFKDFENAPTSSYSRYRLAPGITYKRKRDETARLTAGLDRYVFSEAHTKDQLKPFARAEYWRYFQNRKLKLLGTYAIHTIQEEMKGRERVQRDLRAGADYKFGVPAFYKLMARAGWGNRDTRMDSDPGSQSTGASVDEDYDYDYSYAYLKSEHRLSPEIKTTIKYQVFRKDYDTAPLDHDGFFVQNGWDILMSPTNDPKVTLEIDGEFKQTDHETSADSYQKKLIELRAAYQVPRNFKLSAGAQICIYDYEGSAGDKERLYMVWSGEKYLPDSELTLSLEVKYRATDNETASDSNKSSARLSAHKKF